MADFNAKIWKRIKTKKETVTRQIRQLIKWVDKEEIVTVNEQSHNVMSKRRVEVKSVNDYNKNKNQKQFTDDNTDYHR